METSRPGVGLAVAMLTLSSDALPPPVFLLPCPSAPPHDAPRPEEPQRAAVRRGGGQDCRRGDGAQPGEKLASGWGRVRQGDGVWVSLGQQSIQ